MTAEKKSVAIIGAGIVGVSAAIELQRDGHQVILIDRKGPGEGTCHGNDGILASCSIVPVTGPGPCTKAPKMLLNPDQPLFMRWGYLSKLATWLIKYIGQPNAADTARIALALAPIVADSLADHQALLAGTRAERHLFPSNDLFLYNDRSHFGEDEFGWGLRRKHGVRWDELEGAAVRTYDNFHAGEFGFAARLKDHGIILEPGAVREGLGRPCNRQWRPANPGFCRGCDP